MTRPDANVSYRQNDPKQAHYAYEAREFLRKRIVGRHVRVSVDFIRPKEGEFEERECVTIRYGGNRAFVPFSLGFVVVSWLLILHCRNIAEQIIEKGLASVVRHRRDDEDRSSDYDKLMAAEQA